MKRFASTYLERDDAVDEGDDLDVVRQRLEDVDAAFRVADQHDAVAPGGGLRDRRRDDARVRGEPAFGVNRHALHPRELQRLLQIVDVAAEVQRVVVREQAADEQVGQPFRVRILALELRRQIRHFTQYVLEPRRDHRAVRRRAFRIADSRDPNPHRRLRVRGPHLARG